MENNKNDRMLEIFMRSLRGEAVKELFALVKILLGSRVLSKDEVLTLIYKLKKFTTVNNREKLDNLIRKEIYHYPEVKSDCKSVIENKQLLSITYYKMNRDEVKHKIKPVSIMFSEYYLQNTL